MLFGVETIEKHQHMRWLVLHTKPRCEKKLAQHCRGRGIIHYLPLRRSIRRYPNRVAEFMVPIFSGYLFAQMHTEDQLPVVEAWHLARAIVPDEQMEASLIRELGDILILERATIEGELMVRPEIEAGKVVQISSGPLAGLHGIVSRRKNKARLCVNVEMVGQSVSIEVDVNEVEIEY